MRLHDSDRWRETWFMGLPSELKLLWVYICDNIDNAAVWPVNKGLAEYQIGSRIDWGLALESFSEHVHLVARGDKWYLHTVLAHQQPSGIGSTNKVHVNIRALLMSHHIDQRLWPSGGLPGALQGPLTTLPNSPLPSQDSLGGSVEGGAALEPKPPVTNRDRLAKFARNKRLSGTADALDELIGLARDMGCKGIAETIDMLDWSVDQAREKPGSDIRFARHFEAEARAWRKMKQETERITKATA